MPISPDRFIQCQSDGWIAVRKFDGTLLGAFPGNPPQEDFIQSPIGSIPVYAGVVYCAVPGDDMLPRLRELPGFVPADEHSLELARPVASDDQSDIGQPV